MPKGVDLPPVQGEMLTLNNGLVQLLTTKDEALEISHHLIERKAQFSVNPVTLDDIFTYMVGAMDPELRESKEVEEE